MHAGKVLDDVNPKGMTIDDLTAPIRNVKTNGRDIVTEFHFLRGSWQPSSRNVDDKPVRQDLAKPYAATDDACAAASACVDCSDTKKGFVIPDEVFANTGSNGMSIDAFNA